MKPLFARCVAALAGAVCAAPAFAQTLPDPVHRYYEDMNLVARYSVPEERVQLMSGRRDAAKAGPRLQAVDAALKRLGQYKTVNYTMRYQWGQDSQRERWIDLRTADPMEIERVEAKDDVLNVRVRTFTDSPRDKLQWIGHWDRDGVKPAEESAKPRDYKDSRTEVHTWRLVEGQWLREPANLVLLDSARPAPAKDPKNANEAKDDQAREKRPQAQPGAARD